MPHTDRVSWSLQVNKVFITKNEKCCLNLCNYTIVQISESILSIKVIYLKPSAKCLLLITYYLRYGFYLCLGGPAASLSLMWRLSSLWPALVSCPQVVLEESLKLLSFWWKLISSWLGPRQKWVPVGLTLNTPLLPLYLLSQPAPSQHLSFQRETLCLISLECRRSSAKCIEWKNEGPSSMTSQRKEYPRIWEQINRVRWNDSRSWDRP